MSAKDQIAALYDSLLGRAPDAGGAQFWESALASGASINDIASAIAGSAEAQVYNAYQAELGREPDDAGRDFWVDAVASGNATIDQVVNAIAGSNEAQIYDAYKQELGRAPDKEGMEFWNNAINSGQATVEQVIQAINNSQEGQQYDKTKGEAFDPNKYVPADSYANDPSAFRYDRDIVRQVMGSGNWEAYATDRYTLENFGGLSSRQVDEINRLQLQKDFDQHMQNPANRAATLEQYGYASPDAKVVSVAKDWRGIPVAELDANGRMISWRPTTDPNFWVTRDDLGDITGFTNMPAISTSFNAMMMGDFLTAPGQGTPLFESAGLTGVALTPPEEMNWLIPAGMFAAVLAPAIAPSIMGLSGTSAALLQSQVLTNIATMAGITAGASVASGVPLDQAIQNGVVSMLGSGVSSVTGAALSSAAAAGLSDLATKITNVATQSATSAAIAAATGGDPIQAAISSGISGAVNGFMPDVLGSIQGFSDLPIAAQRVIERAASTAVSSGLQGKDPTQAVLMSVLNNTIDTTQKFLTKVPSYENISFGELSDEYRRSLGLFNSRDIDAAIFADFGYQKGMGKDDVKKIVEMYDPAFNAEEYKKINNLPANVDPYSHFIEQGASQDLPTNLPSQASIQKFGEAFKAAGGRNINPLDIIRGAAQIEAGEDPATVINRNENLTRQLITAAYETSLGRKPDEEGLNNWLNWARSGTPVGTIVDSIRKSPEAQVYGVYKDVFKTKPDEEGSQYWVNKIAAGEVTADALANAFQQYEKDAQAKIVSAYQNSLGRTPDKTGLTNWMNAARAGTPIDTLVDLIANSPESKVRGAYRDIFDREPDARGLDFWTSKVNSGEISLDDVLNAFRQSNEYLSRSMGVDPTKPIGSETGTKLPTGVIDSTINDIIKEAPKGTAPSGVDGQGGIGKGIDFGPGTLPGIEGGGTTLNDIISGIIKDTAGSGGGIGGGAGGGAGAGTPSGVQPPIDTSDQEKEEEKRKRERENLMGMLIAQPGPIITSKPGPPTRIDYLYDFSDIFATPEQASLFPSPYGAITNMPQSEKRDKDQINPFELAEGGSVEDLIDYLKGR